jgi:hypothetical protein
MTIGTPHQGAGAKIYMELLQGYNLGAKIRLYARFLKVFLMMMWVPHIRKVM